MKQLYTGESLRRETAREIVMEFLSVLCVMVLIGVLFVIMFLL